MRRRPIDDATPIARIRNAIATRQGRLYGFITGALVQGSSTSFSIIALNLASGNWEDTGEIVTGVREFTLNLGEEYLAGVKGWIHWYVNTWVFNTDVCDPDDTGLFTPPPSQGGTSGGSLLGSASEGAFAALVGSLSPAEPGFFDDQLISR